MTSGSNFRRSKKTRSSCSVRSRTLSDLNALSIARWWSLMVALGGLGLFGLDHYAVLVHLDGIRYRCETDVRPDARRLVDLGFELLGYFRVLAQEALCVVAPLTQ